MAVNINTVYTTVLFILNKEQRGYIPPAEFNSLAVQVQNDIFESYFPDGNQVNRFNQSNRQNDTEFFDMFKDISYKLFPFTKEVSFTSNGAISPRWTPSVSTVYKLGVITANYLNTGANDSSMVNMLDYKEYQEVNKSKLTKPTKKYPAAFTENAIVATKSVLALSISPIPNSVSVNCLLNPTAPSWSFAVGTLGQYIYNSTTSVDFELDISEQNTLIINILKYAGIIIKDPQIVQVAAQEAQAEETNLKS